MKYVTKRISFRIFGLLLDRISLHFAQIIFRQQRAKVVQRFLMDQSVHVEHVSEYDGERAKINVRLYLCNAWAY